MKRFLQNLFGKKPQPIRSAKPQRTFQPRVDGLEDRLLMASSVLQSVIVFHPVVPPPNTYLVTTPTGTGAGSLPAAIAEVNADSLLHTSPDVIDFRVPAYYLDGLAPMFEPGFVP